MDKKKTDESKVQINLFFQRKQEPLLHNIDFMLWRSWAIGGHILLSYEIIT